MRLQKMTAFAIGLLATAAGLGTPGMTRADRVDDYLKSEMAHRHIPGLTVAVVQDGKVVKEQGYGLANVESSAPATPATVYLLASMSKQFTAAGIMLLVRDGRVGLDDAAGKYLDGLPPTWRGVTVRQLLNQTSGIPEWVPNPDKDPLLKTYTVAEIARHAAVKPPAFVPGSRFAYSNTNYNLLAGIIEKASGGPYGDFLRARIFAPLGMNETGVYDPMEITANRAAGYVRLGGKLFNNPLIYDPSLLAGAGGLQSTAGDLVKWDAALAAGTLLPPSSLAQMWTPPALPGGAHSEYGMGWVNQTVNGHRILWHNGELPGTLGFLGRFPDDHLTVILLSNMSPLDGPDDAYPFLPLGQAVAGLFIPALAPPKGGEAQVEEEEAGKQAASAEMTPVQAAQVFREVLTALAAGKADVPRLTPAMSAALTPAVIAQTNHNLAAAGAFQPETLALLSRTTEHGLRVYRCRALYGKVPVLWTMSVTPDNKIAGMVPQTESGRT